MYNSVVLGIHTQFYNHHHPLIPECFHHHRKNLCTLAVIPISTFLLPLATYFVGFPFKVKKLYTSFLYCCCSVSQLCLTICNPMDCSTPAYLSFTISRGLLKLMYIELVMPSKVLIFCSPLLLLPSIFPSIMIFSNESVLLRWPKYWDFSFSISRSNEYLGLISFMMTCLISLQSKGLSKVFPNIIALKQHFFGVQPFLWSNSHTHT